MTFSSTQAMQQHHQDDEQERVRATKAWLETIVLGEKLCPFAPPVREPPKLRLRASRASTEDEVVLELREEALLLRAGIDQQQQQQPPQQQPQQQQQIGEGEPPPETSLLILSDHLSLSWRDLTTLSWRLQTEVLVDGGHGEELQIVLFHPLAQHSVYGDPDAPPDAGDYTIRAPHPTVQLLREVDVLRGVGSYPDAAGIPGRNRTRFRAQGVEACARRLEACRSSLSSISGTAAR